LSLRPFFVSIDPPMALEATDQLDQADDSSNNQDFEGMKQNYLKLVWESRSLSTKDKQLSLSWMDTISESNKGMLKLATDTFKNAERSVEELNQAYSKELNDAVKKGLFSKGSVKAYETWFNALSYGDKSKHMKEKTTDLHDPKRQRLLDVFNGKAEMDGERLPTALRKECNEAFMKADLAEREKLLTKWLKHHATLKKSFLGFPAEVQKKYAEAFKKAGFKGREGLIAKIKREAGMSSTEIAAQEKSGAAENLQMDKAFNAKTSKMVKEDLLTKTGKASYDSWYKGLSKEEKTKMADSSELDSRMKDRIQTRDEGRQLITQQDPALRGPLGKEFGELDLDGRLLFIAKLQGKLNREKGQEATPYPPSAIDAVIDSALKTDTAAKEMQLVHTIFVEKVTLRKRAELMLHAQSVEGLTRAAASQGREVDFHTSEAAQRVQHARNPTKSYELEASEIRREKQLEAQRKESQESEADAQNSEGENGEQSQEAEADNVLDFYRQARKARAIASNRPVSQETEEEERENEGGTEREFRAEKSQPEGQKVDHEEHIEAVVEAAKEHSETLSYAPTVHRREIRQGIRREMIEHNKLSQNKEARDTNTRFLSADSREISADQFKKTIMAHQRDELTARLTMLTANKLPGIDPTTLEKHIAERDLRADLRRTAA